MQQHAWRLEAGGVFTTEEGELRLIVREISGASRFLVVRRTSGSQPFQLALGSGTEHDVKSAMRAAEGMAARFAVPGNHAMRKMLHS